MTMLVNDGNSDADIKLLVAILNPEGNLVTYDSVTEKFTDMPMQEKAALNNFLRLRSKRINNDLVEENSVTWSDL
jgi:hypothetical protein